MATKNELSESVGNVHDASNPERKFPKTLLDDKDVIDTLTLVSFVVFNSKDKESGKRNLPDLDKQFRKLGLLEHCIVHSHLFPNSAESNGLPEIKKSFVDSPYILRNVAKGVEDNWNTIKSYSSELIAEPTEYTRLQKNRWSEIFSDKEKVVGVFRKLALDIEQNRATYNDRLGLDKVCSLID